MNGITREWKVYGADGHRQKESFGKSVKYDWSKEGNILKLEVDREDVTGTNEYVIVRITRNTAAECEKELEGQISDGLFENSLVGKVEEIITEKVFDKEEDFITQKYLGE